MLSHGPVGCVTGDNVGCITGEAAGGSVGERFGGKVAGTVDLKVHQPAGPVSSTAVE